MEYRTLAPKELTPSLFSSFIRRQTVRRCFRKVNGVFVVRDISFTEDWGKKEYQYLTECLKRTIRTGGTVFGAFYHGRLKGFASLENLLFGSKAQYLELSSLHVSKDMRKKGIGRTLFLMAAQAAKRKNAKALYISSHSAVETQAFYRAMRCVEAREYDPAAVKREPFDCQLEFSLSGVAI